MPGGLRTPHLSFTESHLTRFGAMVLLQRFCNQVRLRRLLQHYVKGSHRNVDYLPSDMILAVLYAVTPRLRRIHVFASTRRSSRHSRVFGKKRRGFHAFLRFN